MENKDENQKKNNELIAKAKTLVEQHEKLLVSVVIGIVVILAAILILMGRNKGANEAVAATEDNSSSIDESLLQEPLEENAHDDVNSLMTSFYAALAEGDMDTVKSIKDHTDDTEIITYEKKSEFIESYNNLIAYTKKGTEEGSYFVYEYYEVKFYDIETMAPGLNTWYVYTKEDGTLAIDGDMDESVTAYLKLVTSMDDVVDLFNKVDVKYNEAIDADEALNTFLTELPNQIKTSVGVALASLEAGDDEDAAETEEATETETTQEETETESEPEEQMEDVAVNEQVRTTDTVNVRKSDSEEADKLGKAEQGLELTRLETKVNGWSKVIFEGQEAYIKSDYLEVIATNDADTTEEVQNTTSDDASSMVAQTNVNVRNAPNETADKIGVAQAQQSYTVVEKLDDGWMKILYNGYEGFVKSEYFR